MAPCPRRSVQGDRERRQGGFLWRLRRSGCAGGRVHLPERDGRTKQAPRLRLKFWWLTDSLRLAAERRAVEALAEQVGWFELSRWWVHEGKLSAEGVIVAHGHRYEVRLAY